jgi:hypothetical protein
MKNKVKFIEPDIVSSNAEGFQLAQIIKLLLLT